MATLIHDATVITPDAGGWPVSADSAVPGSRPVRRGGPGRPVRVLRHYSLVLDAGRVSALAPAASFTPRRAGGEFAEVVQGTGYVVTPGLVNTHHHLYQSLTRCLPAAQNDRLFDWLRKLYEQWRRLDYHAVNLAAKVSIAELLLHGCTTTSDHFYMFPPGSDVRLEAVLDAATELGIRLHLCRGSMSLGRSGGGLPPDDCVEQDTDVLADCQRVLDAYHDPQPYAMRRIDLAPCSPFNVTRELLRDTRRLARERDVLLHTHLAETLDEEAYCLDKFGCRPAQYLADLDWLGPDVYLAHCVWLNEAEIALLARTNTAVSLCPTSNMRLGSAWWPRACGWGWALTVPAATTGETCWPRRNRPCWWHACCPRRGASGVGPASRRSSRCFRWRKPSSSPRAAALRACTARSSGTLIRVPRRTARCSGLTTSRSRAALPTTR
jgi:cytosine/adenosine deaminase-related metal-dependent hydrolase